MKSSKWHTTVGIELPNNDKIRMLGKKETNKNLRILGATIIKKLKKKEKIKKIKRTKKLLETKQCSRNFIKGINTEALSLFIYSPPFLK